MIVEDRRPSHAGTFGLIRQNPSWPEVADLFKLRIDKSLGENAAPQGGLYFAFIGVSLNEGPAIYRVEVRGISGKPMPGAKVVRHWPNSPTLQAGIAPAYFGAGVVGITESGGDKAGAVEFPYSGGSVTGPNGGPDSFWVGSGTPTGNYSDLAAGFGWWGNSNHFNANPIIQIMVKGDIPPDNGDQPKPPAGGLPEEFVEEALIIDQYFLNEVRRITEQRGRSFRELVEKYS